MEDLMPLVIVEHGKVMLSAQVEQVIDLCEDNIAEANDNYNKVKEVILNAMLDNNLKNTTVGKYKISIREYNDKWTFDAEKFVEEENEEIVIAFSSVVKNKTETLNIEKLKTQFPEVYASCLDVEEQETLVVDEHKLWQHLRKVWEKYATKVEGKAPTITIKKVES